MDTKTPRAIWHICQEAYERGHAHGTNDRHYGYHNPTPLAGEYAGESPRELMGDLLDEAEQLGIEWDWANEVMESYEEGYADGNCD